MAIGVLLAEQGLSQEDARQVRGKVFLRLRCEPDSSADDPAGLIRARKRAGIERA